MEKQIFVRSLGQNKLVVEKLFQETFNYLRELGFKSTPICAIGDSIGVYNSVLFEDNCEKILIEYSSFGKSRVLKLTFSLDSIQFVYDILLMRFNQIARNEQDFISIYSRK